MNETFGFHHILILNVMYKINTTVHLHIVHILRMDGQGEWNVVVCFNGSVRSNRELEQ